ncbi:MAG: NAD(P)/FAD-dependent oxidoreductase [Vogesella sp.]|uniref:NAD(P)/FAD-dependent oxidoreductase n=1 Tax=Vogesella sp. TaxID=1904252 RepID=UPI003F34E028
MDADVIVLGAGMVGVSAALALQQRGRQVWLLDRRAPGEETSHGNAGLLERAAVIPYGFPRQLSSVLRLAANRSPDVRYHPATLPSYAGWLWQYWRESAPARLAATGRAMLPLLEACLPEHDAWIRAAGVTELRRSEGLLEAWRGEAAFFDEAANAQRIAREYGLGLTVLDAAALRQAEPGLGQGFSGAIHWHDPHSIRDPGALVRGYAAFFQTLGGVLKQCAVKSLRQAGSGWQVLTDSGVLRAREVVLALGPWSDDVFTPLGYRIPLQVKRGYHMHYHASGPGLQRTVVDMENSFLVAPMARGLRLATGVELARRDALPTPNQLAQAEALAQGLFPLGARVDAEPWVGCRPCLPDMRPVIGAAPRHPGLWFSFGHSHLGLTLGPVSGRLLAEMMLGERPFTDPAPYSPARFA